MDDQHSQEWLDQEGNALCINIHRDDSNVDSIGPANTNKCPFSYKSPIRARNNIDNSQCFVENSVADLGNDFVVETCENENNWIFFIRKQYVMKHLEVLTAGMTQTFTNLPLANCLNRTLVCLICIAILMILDQ